MARHKVDAELYEKATSQTRIEFGDRASDISAGDLLVIHDAIDNSTSTASYTDNLSTSWTKLQGNGTGGGSSAVFYKVAVGGETYVDSNTNNDGLVLLSIIEGANTTSPIDTSAGSTAIGVSNYYDAPNITTTEANTYVIHCMGLDGNRNPSFAGRGIKLYQGTGQDVITTSISVNAALYSTAGLISNQFFYGSTDGGGINVIAIRDATPSTPTIGPQSITDPLQVLKMDNFADPGTKIADPIWRSLESDQSFDAATAISGTDITIVGHGYAEAQLVRYQAAGGTVIGGLTDNTVYHVNYVDDDTIRLRTFDGARFDEKSDISLTAGTGTQRFEDYGVYGKAGDDDEVDFVRSVIYTKNVGVSSRTFSDGPIDFSGKQFSLFLDGNSRIEFADVASFGLGIGLLDSNDNYRAWIVGGRDNLPTSISDNPFDTIEVDSTATALKTEGSFDSTDVTDAFFFCRTAKQTNTPEIRSEKYDIGIGETPTLIGGDSTLPIDLNVINDSIRRSLVGVQGEGQFLPAQFINIGDGTNPTYFEIFNALEFYPKYDLTFPTANLHIPKVGLSVNLGNATDAFILGYALNSAIPFTFEIQSGSNASATYDFDGLLIVNCNEFVLQSFIDSTGCQLIDSEGVDLNSASITGYSFDNCAKVEQDGGTVTNCTFKNASGIAFELTDGSKVSGCIFNDNVSGIEIASAGNYTFNNFSYSSNTQDVNVTATTGTVNIDVVGDNSPTFITAGATVNITKNVDITAPNLLAGTRVQLYNVTKAAELDNSLVSGGSGYSYQVNLLGATADVGDTIRMRSIYVSGLSCKAPIESTAVLSGSGLSFIDTQSDCPIYVANGIDGSTVTEFSADYPNIEIDINDPDGTTSVQRIFAWYIYNLTTADGVRNLFGGLVAEDAINYKIVTSIVDLEFDNVGSAVVIEGARIFRDDDTTVIASTTTGSIQIDPGKAYLATGELTADLEVINIGVQKASKLIPHNTNL